MAHKRDADDGVFESAGKAVDKSLTMAAALRAGKLTRSQFDAWYTKRTAEGADLIVNLRERTTRLLEPIEAALEQSGLVLRAAAPPARHRAHRRRVAARAPAKLHARRK